MKNAETIEACFHNGNGDWDSRNMTNYIMYVGIYGVKDKEIYELE